MIDWGLATLVRGGQNISGDRHVIVNLEERWLFAVADGLGHGPEAAAASSRCIATLEAHVGEPLAGLVRRCHEALQGTRGVALSVACLNGRDSSLTWLGVGNVETVLLRHRGRAAPERQFLLLRSGVVGGYMPRLIERSLPIRRGDTFVMVTDGIRADFAQDLDGRGPPQQVADEILASHATGADDALVLVVRYQGEGRERRAA